jgi:acyl transferase domain-containing protein
MSADDVELRARMARALESASARIEQLERQQAEPIAIVGMACRFPGGADDPAAFWRLLLDGRDAVGPMPDDRCDLDARFSPDPDRPGHTYVRVGAFLTGVDRFDAGFFGISPREAAALDPQQRLLLETTWHAFEDAGVMADRIRGTRTGVFVGLTTTDYGRAITRDAAAIDAHYVTGTTLNMAAGRLSYWFGLRGPSMAIDTACSSSLVAIHVACQNLRTRECDAAIAAGVNVIASADGFIALSKAGVLARDGRCRTFDEAASGMGRGEGCGVLVLKRLSDALADGDRIAALVRGSAVNQDGASAGLTVPNGPAQQDVIRRALASAALRPDDIDYVEAHGTGTALGDPIEVGALADVFGPGRAAERPLVIGSVKANIAHLESAAGVAGVVKTILCLQQGEIPPQVHLTKRSPHVAWHRLPVSIPTEIQPWPAVDRPRRAGVSAFGLSGTNAHVILEAAPSPASHASPDESDATPHLLVMSAASDAALREVGANYAARLDGPSAPRLNDVCRAAAIHRSHLPHRAAIVATSAVDVAEIAHDLARAHHDLRVGSASETAGGLAFVFTGQGSQYRGMGRSLYEREPVFRRTIDDCEAAAGRRLLFDDDVDINDTQYAQPALVALEIAIAALLRSWGIAPSAVIGHSVGEFAAAQVADVFDMGDVMALVRERSRLMGSLPRDGAMLSVIGGDATAIDHLVRAHAERLAIAAINAPGHIVLSGATDLIDAAAAQLTTTGATCRRLVVSHAYHSPLMASAADAFGNVLARVTPRAPQLPFASNVTGDVTGTFDRGDWARQMLSPVQFGRGVDALQSRGIRVFLEIGPHPTLVVAGRACTRDARWIPTLTRGADEWRGIRLALAELFVAGATIDWTALHGTARADRVALPKYPFQRKRFWLPQPANTELAGAVHELHWVDAAPERQSPVSRAYAVVDPHSADVHRALDVHIGANAIDLVYVAGETANDLGAVLTMVQTVASIDRRPPVRVWIITRGAQAIGTHVVSVDHASLWGLARVAALEHPDIWGGIIDTDPRLPIDHSRLARTIASKDVEAELALRDGRTLVPRLQTRTVSASTPAAFASDAVYLVTGGAGALGLTVAEWMVTRGARRLLLSGRHAPHGDALARIDAMRRLGATVTFAVADIGNRDEVDAVVAAAGRLGPLRGVVHAAGVALDGMLRTQTAASFEEALHGKALGARHLDAATRSLDLECFVLFSSLAAIVGSAGQGPYAAANAALDALAAERRRQGRPALSIAWGPWSGDGMTMRLSRAARQAMQHRGVALFTPEEGLRLLDAVWRSLSPTIVAARFDAAVLRDHVARARRSLLDDEVTVASAPVGPTRRVPDATQAIADPALLDAYLTQTLTNVLHVEDATSLSSDRPLQDYGVDSMLATEFRNRLLRELAVDVPIATFLSRATLRSVADAVVRALVVRTVSGSETPDDTAVEEIVL